MEKQVILDVLKKSIHNILGSCEDKEETVIVDSRITQSLCSSIEAMFLHGEISTKSTGILHRFGKIKQMYEYDFKNFIIEFIPRNVLKSLENHEFKLTNIGFSRVWLRCTLNESTILSYIESMIKDEKRLKSFYIKESLIRDEELMGAFCGLLKSIEHLIFNLDTSLPLLNTWVNSDALQIAGLQHHALSNSDTNQPDYFKTQDNIFNTEDKSLSLLLSNEEEILPTNLMSIRGHSSASVPKNNFFQSPSSVVEINNCNHDSDDEVDSDNDSNINFDEDKNSADKPFMEPEVFVSEEVLNSPCTNTMSMTTSSNCESEYKNINFDVLNIVPVISNGHVELNESVFPNETSDNGQNENHNQEVKDLNNDTDLKNEDLIYKDIKPNLIESKILQDSFDQLWTNCNMSTIIPSEEIRVNSIEEIHEPSDEIIFDNVEIHNEIEPSKVYSSFIINRVIASTADLISNISKRRFPFRFFTVKESEDAWVFIGDELLTRNSDLKKLMDLYPGVNETSSRSGENSVFGGLCHKCHGSLETNKVFLDYYDGNLYCFSCESKTKAVIPRDVIANWDFGPKSVSTTTKQFLSEIIVHPNINLATNPCLFDVVPELTRVRKLRHKLSLLWLQVTSCDIDTSTKVRAAMFPREYMLASVKEKDLYSLEDLIMLHNGVLEKTLLHVIDKIAIPHVNKCMVCRMKALACDTCRDKNSLIYIHEIDYYCECSTPLCQSVIHNSCKKTGTKSFYCRRCVQYLESQQPITLSSYDTADTND